jgi:hypothetical protein
VSASICTNSERGLLGVAVDPAFATNHFIYLYYTFNKSGVCEKNTARSPVNRVSRFTLSNASVADRASELVLIDNIPSPNGNHNGATSISALMATSMSARVMAAATTRRRARPRPRYRVTPGQSAGTLPHHRTTGALAAHGRHDISPVIWI